MPTPVAQISGAYQSGIKYDEYACKSLLIEMDELSRRESELVIAQNKRIDTSVLQAVLWGFGQGDGMEASELARVRGEKAAVSKSIALKECKAAS